MTTSRLLRRPERVTEPDVYADMSELIQAAVPAVGAAAAMETIECLAALVRSATSACPAEDPAAYPLVRDRFRAK